jgi:hypothetical protein
MVLNGAGQLSLRETAVTGSVLLAGAGAIATVVGFSKRIEPLIELGVALVVMAMLAKPKAKP